MSEGPLSTSGGGFAGTPATQDPGGGDLARPDSRGNTDSKLYYFHACLIFDFLSQQLHMYVLHFAH